MKLFKKTGAFLLSAAMVLGMVSGFAVPAMAADNPYDPVEFVTHEGVTFGRATEAYQFTGTDREGNVTTVNYAGFPLFNGNEEDFDEYLDLLLSELTISGRLAIAAGGQPTGSYEKDGVQMLYNIPQGQSTGGEALQGAAGQTALSTVMYQAQSWNIDLINDIGQLMGMENKSKQPAGDYYWTSSTGTSMTDMRLNPLSGRYDEGYGEDPAMASMFASANSKGYNGYTNDEGENFYIMASVNTKHYTVYGAQWFRGVSDTQVGVRSFYEYNVKAANKGFADGGISSFMSSYGRINGVPSSSSFITAWANNVSKYDLYNGTDAMADYPYTPYLVSGNEIGQYGNTYNMQPGYDQAYMPNAPYKAASMAISGHKPTGSIEDLQEALQYSYNGITEASLDTICGGYLTIRTRVGIYDEKDANGVSKYYPFTFIGSDVNATDYTSPVSQAVALQNAEEGIVLLKNENDALPLSKDETAGIYGIFAETINSGLYQVGVADYTGRGDEAGFSALESLSIRLADINYDMGLNLVTIQDSNGNYWYTDENGTIVIKTPEEFLDAVSVEMEADEQDDNVKTEDPDEDDNVKAEALAGDRIILADDPDEDDNVKAEALAENSIILADDPDEDDNVKAEALAEDDNVKTDDPDEDDNVKADGSLELERFYFGILDNGQDSKSIYSYGADRWLRYAIADPTTGLNAYAGWTNPLFPNPFEWQNVSYVAVDDEANFRNVPGAMLPPIISGFPYNLVFEPAEGEDEYYLHAGAMVNGVSFVNVSPLMGVNYGFYLEEQTLENGDAYINLGGAYEGARSDYSEGVNYFKNSADKSAMTFTINEILPYGSAAIGYEPEDDAAIIFVGQEYLSLSGEGTDRVRLDMGEGQIEMALNVAELYKAAGKKVIVVIYANYPVNAEVLDQCGSIDAILFAGYGGQFGGKATAEVITGEYAPTGRLVSTWYKDQELFPAISEFSIPRGNDQFDYEIPTGKDRFLEHGLTLDELNPGYTVDMANSDVYATGLTYKNLSQDDLDAHVTYPFGYGGSYSKFSWHADSFTAPESWNAEDGPFTVSIDVENIGDVDTSDVVQVYAAIQSSEYGDAVPKKSLVGFTKVFVPAGETVKAEVTVDPEYLAIWDVNAEDYVVENGIYTICAAPNSEMAGSYGGVAEVAITGDGLAKAPNEELNIWEHSYKAQDVYYDEYSKLRTASAAVEEGVGDNTYEVEAKNAGAWTAIPKVDLTDLAYVDLEAGAPDGISGTIEVRLDGPDGDLLASFNVESTGPTALELKSDSYTKEMIHELKYKYYTSQATGSDIHDIYIIYGAKGLRAAHIDFLTQSEYEKKLLDQIGRLEGEASQLREERDNAVFDLEMANSLIQELLEEIESLKAQLEEAKEMIDKTPGWHMSENGEWCYYAEPGVLAKGWLYEDGFWYYLDMETGIMQTGWIKLGDIWYFLKSNGQMAQNEWIDGYWLGASGAWTYYPRGSWKKNNAGWWYGDTSGWYAAGSTQKIDYVNYTFNASGYWVG